MISCNQLDVMINTYVWLIGVFSKSGEIVYRYVNGYALVLYLKRAIYAYVLINIKMSVGVFFKTRTYFV